MRIGILLCFGALALLLIYLNHRSGGTPATDGLSHEGIQHQPSSHGDLKSMNPMARVIESYRTPIEFYGKVVDQNGEPVGGASVKIFPFDQPFGERESKFKMSLTRNANGTFSVKGINGLAMGVEIRKEGYLEMPDYGLERPASSRRIEYGLDGSGGLQFKDPQHPTLFTLHKLGPLEPQAYIAEKSWRLPVDGNPRSIALDSEKGVGSHQIEFRFDTDWARISKDSDALFGIFDWKLEMRILGGGFVRSRSDYALEAPESGYEESIRFDHPKDNPNWKKTDSGRYFVKFRDGTYGRIRFSIAGNSDSETGPLSMTSWMSLKPGSRNLASDKKDGNVMMDE